MAEGIQAGRLEVTVVAALDGFARELRTKVEAAAEGLAVKVQVEVDSKGLRKRLKTAVKEASAGLTAKVNLRIDRSGIRAELEEAARNAASTDVRVPIRPDDESGAGGSGGGLLGRLRSLLRGAQTEAEQNPVNIPIRMRMPRRRGALRMLGLGALVTLIQPAVGALTLYGGALTALVGAAAPAVGVLGALPGLLAAGGTAAIATKVAFGGFGEALKETFKAQAQLASGAKLTKEQQQALDESLKGLSESARKTVKNVASLSGEWRTMRQSVQERFFSKISDEIKPLSNAVLPLLKDSLGDAAGQMGELAQRGAKAMQSGPFAKDFKTVAGTNSKVIGNITDGVGNLAAATGHFLVASGPFVERVGEAGERFTRYIRSSAQAGRETGSLARFLDHAAEKAKQLGRTTLYLSEGLAGVGRAGMDAGNALLNGLEGTMLRFSRWANSDAGKKTMGEFFSDAAPVFHELNMLVGDLGRGLAKMAKDNGLADLIHQIRTELMPGIGRFLDAIGRTVGPAVIGIISNLATAIASLSAAGSGLGVLLATFNGLLNIFNGLLRVVPGLGMALGILLATMMVFKVVSGITTAMSGMATAVRNLGSASSVATGAMGPHISTWQRMNMAYTGAATGAGRMSGALAAVRSGLSSMSLGMGGLLGALGGPWGAAITAVTIGLGLLANSHEKASRAAAAQQQRISSLAQALRDSNGAIDANVRAQAVQLLQDAKLGDGKTKLVDKLRGVGVGLTELTNLYLDQGNGLADLETKLRKLADAKQEYINKGKDTWVKGDGDESKRYRSAAAAVKALKGELSDSMRTAKEGADAMNDAGKQGTDAYSRLKTAVDGMSNSTASADERVNSLKRALDALTGGTESFHDAQTRVNSAILSVKDAMEENTEKLKDAAGELVNYDGSVNTATKAGQSFNTHLKELRDSAASAAVAAYDLAKTNGTPLSEALAKGQGEMTKAREAAVAYGMDLGLTKEQAEGLANSIGLMPSTVSILLNAKGIPEANAQILNLHAQLATLPAGKTIQVTAPGDDAIAALRGVGYEVTMLPGGKMVSISAPTDAARGQLQQFIDKLAAAPADKNVTVNALIHEFAAELESAKAKIAAVPADKDTTLNALTTEARRALEELGYKIKDVPGSKDVTVSAPTGNAIGSLNNLQERIDNLRGKTVHVTVSYDGVNSDGSPHIAGMGHWANGGILKFAEGGFHNASRRIKAFANGTEKHVAQIARAGEMRLWAEPETAPGEAYIPLAPKKRKRSAAILDTVARFFGGMVVYPGQATGSGALSQFANGAVSMHQSSRITAPRPAVPTGNTALVGGDLNLTLTGAPMTPGEALNDAMFELRRIKRGGAHAAS
ncbi:hypothetical protein [Streptomyces virginiae]|uniref:hypothetical protein n=1 Tax=Streptomyces virginiae TaxID=1961 RepID=UPI003654E8B2